MCFGRLRVFMGVVGVGDEQRVLPRYKTATVEAWGALKARWAEENANRLDNWSAIGRCVCVCQ
jgi:hypothetical protein